jgi:CHRD domain
MEAHQKRRDLGCGAGEDARRGGLGRRLRGHEHRWRLRPLDQDVYGEVHAAAPAAAVAAVVLAAGAIAVGKPGGANSRAKPNLEKRVLFAVLSGRNEVDQNGRRGAGDPNGRGSFTAIVKGNQLCFGITVKKIDQPILAHIHRGRPNQNGPIVVPLTPPSTGDPGASSGYRRSGARSSDPEAPPPLLRERPHGDVPERGCAWPALRHVPLATKRCAPPATRITGGAL